MRARRQLAAALGRWFGIEEEAFAGWYDPVRTSEALLGEEDDDDDDDDEVP
jgi:hypothetical protein